MRKKKFFFAPILCIPFLGCGSSDSNHSIVVPDAHTGSGSGSGSGSGTGSAAPCTANADYGAVTLNGEAEWSNSADDIANNGVSDEEAFGLLGSDATPDLLDILLFDGYGGFGSDAVKTGTFALGGDEASFATCGLCVQILTDLASDGTPVDTYYNTGGSITLSMVGTGSGSGSAQERTGTLSGSISNVTFTHVTIADDNTTTPVGDCDSKITSASFSGTLTLPDAGNVVASPLHIHALVHRHR